MQLSNKEIRLLNEQIETAYHLEKFFDKKDRVEKKDASKGNKNGADDLIYQNGVPVFFTRETLLIPTLKLLSVRNVLSTVVIDMPAVPFIIKGADLMRPGIISCDSFLQDAIVAIVDEKHRKAVAVGRALCSSEELLALNKGKGIQNLHYVGDMIWNIE